MDRTDLSRWSVRVYPLRRGLYSYTVYFDQQVIRHGEHAAQSLKDAEFFAKGLAVAEAAR